MSDDEPMVDQAVQILLDSMTKPALWHAVSGALGAILGRGRKKPDEERAKLDKAREVILKDPRKRAQFAEEIRDHLSTVLDLRDGSVGELSSFVDNFRDSSGHQSEGAANAEACDGAVAQSAGRDLTITNQTITSRSRRRSRLQNPR